MFVSCVHPVAFPYTVFCMTCSLVMLVKDARGNHMEEAYARVPRRHSMHEGWNAADICTNCVYTIPAPRYGGPITFFGKPAIAPCGLHGSAPHKSGERRVKSWPDNNTHKQTHSSHLDLRPLSQTNKQETNLNQM